MSPFKKGHNVNEGRKRDTSSNEKKQGNGSLNTYYYSKSRFKKGGKYLDPERVDYYINNDMDLGELLDD
jgi:hypothetical protein